MSERDIITAKAIRALKRRLERERQTYLMISKVVTTDILYVNDHTVGIGVIFEDGRQDIFEVTVYSKSFRITYA